MRVPPLLRPLLIGLGAACVALAAWLLVPRPAAGGDALPRVRAVVVDASASVVRRRPDWLPWARARLAREARAAAEAGEDVAVIVFAADVALVVPAGPPDALEQRLRGAAGAPLDPSSARDRASDLAGALEVAASLALDPRRPPGRVVLLGDGGWTERDPAPAAGRLAAGGAALARVEPPPPTLGDAAIASISIPRTVEVGAPLTARVELSLAGPLPDRAELVLVLAGSAGTRVERVAVDLPPEDGRAVVPVDLGPAGFGRTEVRARVVVDGLDPFPENDEARATTVAEGELVCGALAAPGAREELFSWIARGGAQLFPGLQVVLLEPDELASTLADLDLLVTFDVPVDALPAELVASFVARGGGWLAVAGFRFLGGWSASDDAPGDLLPLAPAPLDAGPRDVCLLVDGSGSMSGAPFDLVRVAAVEMVAAALPRDEIQLRFFTEALEPPHVLRERDGGGARAREAAAHSLLSARVPGGSTWILASLKMLAAEREREPREALVLLLTDGREAGFSADPEEKAKAVVERLRAARAKLRVIAVGQDADLAFLERLVSPGEELVRAEDLEDLEDIFQREVNRARVLEAEAIEVRARPADAGLAAELLPGAGAAALPPLERLARAQVRPGATVLWESADGDPVLAAWSAGGGRAAAFASAPRAGWGERWIGEAERFGALLRWLGRDRDRGGPSARVERGRLIVEGLEPGWPATVAARVADPDPAGAGAPVELALALAPAHANDPGLGRRAARLPDALLARAAGRTLAVTLERADRPLALAFDVPPSVEVAPWLAEPPLALPERAEPAAAGAGGPGGQERVARAAAPLLALGLVLIVAGAAAGRLARRGPAEPFGGPGAAAVQAPPASRR